MSQENVEIVRASVAAFNRGDLDAALKDAAPGFELDWSRAVGPAHGVLTLDQARRLQAEVNKAWESVRIELDELIDAGEQVVATQTGFMRGRDGIEVQACITQVWTIRDRAIVRVCLYQEKREALEAAGLSE